jgi:hypothetical protein
MQAIASGTPQIPHAAESSPTPATSPRINTPRPASKISMRQPGDSRTSTAAMSRREANSPPRNLASLAAKDEAGTTSQAQSSPSANRSATAKAAMGDDLTTALARAIGGLAPEVAALIGRLAEGLVDASPGRYPPEWFSENRQTKAGPPPDPDNQIVDDRGSSTTTEEPMFSWIAPKPYAQHHRFRVWVKTLDGAKRYETFETETDALVFIEKAQPKLLKGGHAIEDVISEYLHARTQDGDVKGSTLETLGFRLRSVIKNRRRYPIEGFPWARAWDQHIIRLATDTQYGVRSALDGLIGWAVEGRILRRRPPDLPLPKGRKKRGKTRLPPRPRARP